MSALVTGASLALMARFSASRYFDQAIAHRCTVSSLFAAPIRMLLAQPRRPELAANDLRVVIFAQSVAPAQLAEWDERFQAPLLQLWGMTETMGPPLINPIGGERRNLSMGRAGRPATRRGWSMSMAGRSPAARSGRSWCAARRVSR